MSDSVTDYNYVGDTQISASIKNTNANRYTLGEIFTTEILKSFNNLFGTYREYIFAYFTIYFCIMLFLLLWTIN